MNCRNAELYMDALLDNELQVKDSIEVVDHLENCKACKAKWELNEETRSKLKHFVNSIKASDEFRKTISSKLENKGKLVYPFKSSALAASMIFLIGLGIFYNYNIVKIPNLVELHNKTNFQLVSNDIGILSEHVGISLKKSHLSSFEEAMFKPHAAAIIAKSFNKKIGLIALKNDRGEKVSLCFLPENYYLPKCHKIEINGITFKCGKGQNCEFAYWKQNGKTIALVSDALTSEEMIDLATPLLKEV